MSHLVHGRCGACTRPATRFPSGRWEHDGRPCAARSQTLWHVFDLAAINAMLVFVPDGDELPQPAGRTAADRDRMVARFPHDADQWRRFYARPTEWDRVRGELAQEAERRHHDA